MENYSMPENSAISQPLKGNNPCQAAVAKASACPADVQNQFPAAAMFSRSNLVVREISSNNILQALLLSEGTRGQHALLSAAPSTCKSKGRGTVPQGRAGHDGQALSITRGICCLQRWPNQRLLCFEMKPQTKAQGFVPQQPLAARRGPKMPHPLYALCFPCHETGNFLSPPSLLACLLCRARLASVRLFAPA